MRKKNIIWKKTTAVALSLVMAVGLIPAVSKPLTVEAATGTTSTPPSISTFATKDELMSNDFNLDGGTVQKVSFGKGGDNGKQAQTWYIAGYDEDAGNLVLMCDPNMPLVNGTSTSFSYSYPSQRYSVADSQGLSIDTCTYIDGKQVEQVGMNHYGLSKLRATLKQYEKNTEIFTSAEQELMEDTTIYTYDRCNDTYYTTTDKLYAAQAYQDNSYNYYLVVGKNSALYVNKGLKISLNGVYNNGYCTNPYYSHNSTFWLRTPGIASYSNGEPNRAVTYKSSDSYWRWKEQDPSSYMYSLVPAFALDLSSVLFASAIPVNTQCEGAEFSSTAGSTSFIFRMDDNNYGNIQSTIEYTEIETETGTGNETEAGTEIGIKVTKSKKDASTLYLCSQGKYESGADWYKSVRVTETGENIYKLGDLYPGGVTDCKIWIETTTGNVTYAKMAETVSAPTTNVKAGTYTTNQNITLSTGTEGATIYYTTDGSDPTTSETRVTYNAGDVIAVTGKQGESVTTLINAVTETEEEYSRVATYKYVIKLPHVHNWSQSWTSDSNGHWHECSNANCTSTNSSQKSGYAAHTEDSGTVTKAPTATETGVMTYKCSVCGYVMRTEAISATGATPTAPNTNLTVDTENCKVKVTSSSTTNPTVEYIAPTDTKATTIKIPDTVTVDGVVYKVTSIAASAFANNKKITKVTIGKNVTSIGKNTFKNCKKLKTVSLGANVTTINDAAFYKCTALTKITIPAKVNKIGKQAFYGCKNLKSITIKTTKLTSKKVGSKAFKGIYSKATIKVPSKKLSSYKKILKAKGVSSKAKIKK